MQVEGQIPPSVRGMYLRNGPNPPKKLPGGSHWYEGDGMLHTCWIKEDGGVHYTNRFIQTKRLTIEQEAGKKVFLRVRRIQQATLPAARSASFSNESLCFPAGSFTNSFWVL